MSAAHGITLALLARHRTKRGQKVEISMLDAMAALLTYQAGIYFGTGQRPSRRGNKHPSIVPYEVFKASDAYLTLGVANNSLWEQVLRCAGAPRSDQGPALRHRGRARAESRRAGAAAQRGARDAVGGGVDEALRGRRRAGRAHPHGGRGVRERASQGARHDRVAAASQGEAGLRVLGVPIRLHATPGKATTPPPLLGQHTEARAALGARPRQGRRRPAAQGRRRC